MTRPDRLAAIGLFVGTVLTALPAAAHPHVFVDAKTEVVFDTKGNLTAIRHIWQFDEDFSQYATLNLDTNNDGKLDEKELAPLAKVNMDSLKDYDFFTYLLINQKKIAFSQPTEYWLDFHGGRLTLFYTLPLKTPVPINGIANLEVFDPEYFVAFTFVKDNPVTLDGAPKGCQARYQPPHELDTKTMGLLAAVPIDQHDLPPSLFAVASLLANVIIVKCPGTDAADVAADSSVATQAGANAQAAAQTEAAPTGAPQTSEMMLSQVAPATDAPAPPPPAAPPAAPAASANTPVVLDLTKPVAAPAADPTPPPPPPPPPSSGGFLGAIGGWFAGLWHAVFG